MIAHLLTRNKALIGTTQLGDDPPQVILYNNKAYLPQSPTNNGTRRYREAEFAVILQPRDLTRP